MELIKGVVRDGETKVCPGGITPAALAELFLTCSGIREFSPDRDGGAEMFSVDCSLRRRKFALSFSLWSGTLNPFLLQIQSPLLRERVLPFIVNPRFFIAREPGDSDITRTVENDFWESRSAALSAHFRISLRETPSDAATSYPKAPSLFAH